jgi:DNA-binding transcriptional LysR family regulator
MKKENRNISLKQMRAFVAVARAGSFTRAADQLFITQSALSSLIRNLEAELDLRLLDRTTRRLELTDAGTELLGSLEQLLGDLDRMTSDLRDVSVIRRGRVRIGATPLLASTFLPVAIQAFAERYPEITVRVFDDASAKLMQALEQGDIDLLIATLDGVHPELASTVVLTDVMVLVCRSEHRLGDAPRATWHDLLSEPVIAMCKGSGLRTIMDQTMESIGATISPSQEVNHVATAIAMVAAGMGIAVLPAYSVRFGEAAGVRSVPLMSPTVQRHVSLSTLKRRTPSAATQAMADHLLEFARRRGER